MLARQLLLERRPLPLARAVERMGCVQSQYAPSTYVGLWSRVDGLRREAVTRALERRTLVQSTLMRSTIHVVSRRDYWPLAIAIREERRAWAGRVQGADKRVLRRAAERLRSLLAEGPRSQKEIAEAGLWLPGIGLWADLVRMPPAGTWERRRADLFGLAEEWVGPEPELSELEARQHLVRRYLGAFGPAPRTDIANWGGMRIGSLAETFEGMELRRFSDEQGHELLDLPRAPLPPLQLQQPAVRADLPRGWAGRRELASRGRARAAGAVRPIEPCVARRARGGSRAASRVPRVSRRRSRRARRRSEPRPCPCRRSPATRR